MTTWEFFRRLIALVIVGTTAIGIIISVFLGILEQFGTRTLMICVWALLFGWAVCVVWDAVK